MLEILIEFLVTIFVTLKCIFWAMVHTVIPAPQKFIRDDIVLITGAGSGIGRLLSIKLATHGATIVGWDVNKEGNEETAVQVQREGGKMFTYVCDVSKYENVQKVAEQVRQQVGEVTMLINNAGIVTGKRFLDCTEEQLRRTMDVNLYAQFWTVKEFLPSMMENNHGHIINIASIAGVIGTSGLADYCASKFGSVGFTESLEFEIAISNKPGVHLTLVCPYYITTGMFDGINSRFPKLLPSLEPEYAANRIVQAILTNQKVLYMPRAMYLMPIIKGILPVDAGLALHNFIGATHMMDSFVGRKNVKQS